MGFKRKTYSQAMDLNRRYYNHYYNMLTELSINRYKWINLPETVDERFLELALHRNCAAVIFKPWFSSKFLVTQVSPSGKWNVNENPVELRSWGNNGWQYRLGLDDGVLIWGNKNRVPLHNAIDIYATRLADMDRTIDVNLKAQKTPIVITCPEPQKRTMINFYKSWDGNEPLIMGFRNLMEGSTFDVLKTDAPYVADKLLVDKMKIWNEVATLMGINNANTEKKERMLDDEVSSNNGLIELHRLAGLTTRRTAAKEMNRKYGWDIKVVWNTDIGTHNYMYGHDYMISEDDNEGGGIL